MIRQNLKIIIFFKAYLDSDKIRIEIESKTPASLFQRYNLPNQVVSNTFYLGPDGYIDGTCDDQEGGLFIQLGSEKTAKIFRSLNNGVASSIYFMLAGHSFLKGADDNRYCPPWVASFEPLGAVNKVEVNEFNPLIKNGKITGKFLVNGKYLESWKGSESILPDYYNNENRMNVATKIISAMKPDQVLGDFEISNFENLNNTAFGKKATFTSYNKNLRADNGHKINGIMRVTVSDFRFNNTESISPLPYSGNLKVKDVRLFDRKSGVYGAEFLTDKLDSLSISETAEASFKATLALRESEELRI